MTGFEFMRICEILIECLHFSHCDFQRLILHVELNEHIRQLQIDRDSKAINLAKLNSRVSVEVLTLPVAALHNVTACRGLFINLRSGSTFVSIL